MLGTNDLEPLFSLSLEIIYAAVKSIESGVIHILETSNILLKQPYQVNTIANELTLIKHIDFQLNKK